MLSSLLAGVAALSLQGGTVSADAELDTALAGKAALAAHPQRGRKHDHDDDDDWDDDDERHESDHDPWRDRDYRDRRGRRDDDWRYRRDRDGRYGRGGETFYLTCESERNRSNSCRVPGQLRDVRIADRRSNAPCRRGRDWGTQGNRIWVRNGCRATFQVRVSDSGRYGDRRDGRYGDGRYGDGRYGDGRYGGGGYGDRDGRQYVSCASEDNRYRVCRIPGNFDNVRLVDRRSNAGCRRGQDWGVNREGVWVRNGCRAVFSYEYRGGRYRRY